MMEIILRNLSAVSKVREINQYCSSVLTDTGWSSEGIGAKRNMTQEKNKHEFRKILVLSRNKIEEIYLLLAYLKGLLALHSMHLFGHTD